MRKFQPGFPFFLFKFRKNEKNEHLVVNFSNSSSTPSLFASSSFRQMVQPRPRCQSNVDANNNISQEVNTLEYLLQRVALKHVSNVEPTVRALSVRTLGLALLGRLELAESFLDLFIKVNNPFALNTFHLMVSCVCFLLGDRERSC